MLTPTFISPLCTRLAYLLVCEKKMQPTDWVELIAEFYSWEIPPQNRPPLEAELRNCLRLFTMEGYIEQEHVETPELKGCVEEKKHDKRIKDPIRYCLKRKRGRILNIIRPTQKLRDAFLDYIFSEAGAVEPSPACVHI